MGQTIRPIEPRTGLLRETLAKIYARDKRLRTQRRFWAYSVVLSFSLASINQMIQLLIREFQESGFMSFLSLVFSDGHVVFVYWQEFGYSLLETLPIGSLIASLGLCILCLFASRSVLYESKQVLRPRSTVYTSI